MTTMYGEKRVFMPKEKKPLKERSQRQIMAAKDKVREGYNAGFDDEEVCRWAEITLEELEGLARMDKKIARAREQKKAPVNLAARVNIANAITKDGDVKVSMRYLERTDPEFSGKQNITVEGAPVVVPIAEKEKALAEMLAKYKVSGDFDEE